MFNRTRTKPLLLLIILALSSCGTPPPTADLQQVTVYASPATTPWLSDLYECAKSVAIIRLADSPATADIRLQIGEPKYLSPFAYQIDEEEVLVVTHRQNPVQNLTLEQAQMLFTGLGDASVQVWVYAPDDDVFKVFDQSVMKGRSVSSSAKVAVNPQQMSDILNAEPNAVGILPRHWKVGDVRDVYLVAKVPVLAVTQSEPQGAINQMIGCLQK